MSHQFKHHHKTARSKGSRSSATTRDHRMMINNLLHHDAPSNTRSRRIHQHGNHHHHIYRTESDAPSSSVITSSPPINTSFPNTSNPAPGGVQCNLPTTVPPLSPRSSKVITARREFAAAIMCPSPKRGYLECRLCSKEIWGPNGRYHIDKCASLQDARDMARNHNVHLTSIAGINVHCDVFKSTRKPRPKLAKVPGFVMSHSVSVSNPRQALREEDIEAGNRRGRKGYVRCLRCNSEVFAPNARYHALHCEQDTLY